MQGMQQIEDLTSRDTLSEQMRKFLIAAIKARLNIIFAGATGAGKTTTLNILSNYIPQYERIITIEDAAELHLSQEHVVRMEARPQNIEGKGEITIRDLFKNSLRMRPNRIILGEVRGAEALDLLQSISSGHSGSLSVIHASSPRDVAARLETMIMMFGLGMSAEIVRRQIANCVDLLVQHEQLADGSRKVTHIAAITGYKDKEIIIEDLFSFEQDNIDDTGKVNGKFNCSGIRPGAIAEKFKKHNLSLGDYI
jgi:pilus assembly protein CpaF